MNRLSPVIRRLPAPSSAPMTPLRCCEPSPNTVSIWIAGDMYIIEPASATALSPGSSSTSTNCISLPTIRKSTSCIIGRNDCSLKRCADARRGHRGLVRLRGEVFTRVDESIRLKPVLLVVQLPVPPVERQQLDVCPPLDDLSPFEHQNLVGAPDCGETMGNDKRGAARTQTPQAVLNHLFALAVEARGRLV